MTWQDTRAKVVTIVIGTATIGVLGWAGASVTGWINTRAYAGDVKAAVTQHEKDVATLSNRDKCIADALRDLATQTRDVAIAVDRIDRKVGNGPGLPESSLEPVVIE